MYMLLLNHFTFLCFNAFVCACIYLASGLQYAIKFLSLSAASGVGTNFGVGDRRGGARRAESWGLGFFSECGWVYTTRGPVGVL